MIRSHTVSWSAGCSSTRIAWRTWAWFCPLVILGICLTSFPARGDDDEDKYLRIVEIIQNADSLSSKGNTGAALAKYTEAQAELQNFRRTYPDWNYGVVSYRSKYLAEKITACSQTPAAPAENHEPSATGGASTAGAQVKLLEAGAAPRQVLRLHPKPGGKQSVTMKIKMGMNMKMGEMENPAVKLPSMVMAMDVEVQEASSEGDIKYSLLLTDATVEPEEGVLPQTVEAIKTSLAGLKGLSGTGTVTSRGAGKGTEIKTPAGTDPQIQQAMDQLKQSFASLATPLPEEAVGPGAKWESKVPIKSQGMTFDQTTIYELVSIDGEKILAKTAVSQTASNQKIESPAMPGLKMDLTKMTGTGTGELSLDLNQILPQKAEMVSHTEVSMGMNVGAQKQVMNMKMDLNLQFEAK